MRKEVVIAVILGAILGLIVAFGVWRANSVLRVATDSNSSSDNNSKSLPSPSPGIASLLSIQRPQNFDVVSESPVVVTGLTKSNSLVVIYADTKDYLSFALGSGEFNVEVGMTGGINNLLISTEAADTQLTLVYTTAISVDNNSTSPTPQSTDPVRQKLQEKLDQVSNKPSSYIGTVTDKTETGIQIKNGSSEIKQVTVSNLTSFVQINSSSKEVKFADLGIGDYIAAIGLKDANNLLSAQRIIITSATDLTKRKIFKGSVESFSKSQLSVTSGSQKYVVPSNKTVKIYTVDNQNSQKAVAFSAIKEGSSVVVSGTLEGDKLTPRTIFITNPSQ